MLISILLDLAAVDATEVGDEAVEVVLAPDLGASEVAVLVQPLVTKQKTRPESIRGVKEKMDLITENIPSKKF